MVRAILIRIRPRSILPGVRGATENFGVHQGSDAFEGAAFQADLPDLFPAFLSGATENFGARSEVVLIFHFAFRKAVAHRPILGRWRRRRSDPPQGRTWPSISPLTEQWYTGRYSGAGGDAGGAVLHRTDPEPDPPIQSPLAKQ